MERGRKHRVINKTVNNSELRLILTSVQSKNSNEENAPSLLFNRIFHLLQVDTAIFILSQITEQAEESDC